MYLAQIINVNADESILTEDGKISLDMEEWEVGMVAAFDHLIKTEDMGDKFQISCSGNISDGTRIVYIDGGKKDSK